MAAHRYWRLYCASVYSGTAAGVSTLEMYTSVGGADVCSGGTAIGSSQYNATYGYSKAFDGNSSTYWWTANATSPPHWIGYDFGAGNDKDIVQVGILGYSTYTPATFKIEYSDDNVNWTTAANFLSGHLLYQHNQSLENVLTKYLVADNSKSWWRINTTGTSYVYISEIQMRTSAGGADVCTGGVDYADSFYSYLTYRPQYAFDNTDSTVWSTATATGSIGYYFGTTTDVVEFLVRCHSSGSYKPSSLTLQYTSDGGSTWTTAYSAGPGLSWTNGETKTFTVVASGNQSFTPTTGTVTITGQTPDIWQYDPNAVSHRYWRINVTENYSGGDYTALTEVGMYTMKGSNNIVSGGTASASSTYSTNTASKACDGSTSTYWMSATATAPPHWWQYDFGAGNEKAIVEFSIMNNAGSISYSPASFSLAYSDDGINFTTVGGYTKVKILVGTTAYRFNAVNVSKEYWTLDITDSNSGTLINVGEIALHTSVGGADICTGGVTSKTAYTSTYYEEKAFDDDTATYWGRTAATTGRIGYLFSSTQEVVEYTVSAGVGLQGSAPKAWTLDYSSDGGATWTTIDTRSGVTGWSSGETKTYTLGSNQSFTPTTGAITFTGQTPGMGWDINLTPVEGSAVYAGEVPGVTPNAVQFEPSVGSIVYLGYRPGVGQSGTAGGDYRFFFG